MRKDSRQKARNAWVDRQIALAGSQEPSIRRTILSGIMAGISAAVSTLIVSLIQWAIRLLAASGHF